MIFGIVNLCTEGAQSGSCVNAQPSNEPCETASFVLRGLIALSCKIGKCGLVEIIPPEYKRQGIVECPRMRWFDLF